MPATPQKLIPFQNPLDPALVPADDLEWQQWFKSITSAGEIINEIRNESGTLAERIKPQQIIRYGHRLGFMLAREKKLKYSQLRRFVDALKDIEAIEHLETKKIKLKLFQVQLVHGLSRKEELEPFFTVIKGIIENDSLILTDPDFDRFMSLVDSITAYFEIFEDKSKSE